MCQEAAVPCQQYDLLAGWVCREHKLTWCPIYKAASTTWMYNLCLLAGYTEQYIAENPKQLSQLARDAFPVLDNDEAEQVLYAAVNPTKIVYVGVFLLHLNERSA